MVEQVNVVDHLEEIHLKSPPHHKKYEGVLHSTFGFGASNTRRSFPRQGHSLVGSPQQYFQQPR